MGGDRISPLISSTDEESSLEHDFPEHSLELLTLDRGDGLSSKIVDGSVLGKFDDVSCRMSSNSLHFEANQRRLHSVYCEVLSSYDELKCQSERLEEAKLKILSYNPGTWTEKVGGTKLSDYNVPKTTSLLLIGPERSGKSSLVNRISRVFEDDKFASERAQVSYNSYVGDGTHFLQEYMVPRGSTSFCLYDTRSLSDNESENMEMLKYWMTKGVRHGELVSRSSDSPSLKTRMKCKAHQNGYCSSKIKMVNFVIFVVSGLSVLNSMNSDDEAEEEFTNMIATMFNCPFLSFRDDKPVIVVTHGDLLSLSDRAHVRVHLGELLGIHPKKQIFDIPESCDPATELTIIDMLRYSLEHADRNLPGRGWFMGKVRKVPQPGCLLLALILGIAIILALVHGAAFCSARRDHAPQTEIPIDWNAVHIPQTDTPIDWNAIHAPQTDTHIDQNAVHAPQTDTPVDQNAIHSRQTDTPVDQNAIQALQTDTPIDWNAIRYMWLGSDYV